MTDAKFNDLSKEGSEVIRYDQAYKITVYSYANKVNIDFDTKLGQGLGTLTDMLKLARQNGRQWFLNQWTTDPESGKRKMIQSQATLDMIPQEARLLGDK